MPQCKVALDWTKPEVNICILEKGHDDLHKTYGLGWSDIRYGQPSLTMPLDEEDIITYWKAVEGDAFAYWMRHNDGRICAFSNQLEKWVTVDSNPGLECRRRH